MKAIAVPAASKITNLATMRYGITEDTDQFNTELWFGSKLVAFNCKPELITIRGRLHRNELKLRKSLPRTSLMNERRQSILASKFL
jgi:hypothetical protein